MYTQDKREYDNQMDSDTIIMLKDDQNNIQVRESTCQVEWYTVVSVCMWSDQNNYGKIRINVPSKTIRSINIISMSMSQTNISMKHRRNHDIESPNQDKQSSKSACQSPNEYNIHACLQWHQKLSMCNHKKGIHWSTYQTPRLLHPKFKLDLLNNPQWSRHFVDPAFWLMRFPLDGELDFYLKIWFLFD